jgi:hypothetical protein
VAGQGGGDHEERARDVTRVQREEGERAANVGQGGIAPRVQAL